MAPRQEKNTTLKEVRQKIKMFCVFSLKMCLHSYQTPKPQDNQGNLCRPILVLAKESSVADFTGGRRKN